MTSTRFIQAQSPATISRADEPRGLCADQIDDWLWFEHGAAGEAEALETARTICGPCPIRDACAEYATEHNLEGIWGATTEAERRRAKRNKLRKPQGKKPRPVGKCVWGHDITGPDATTPRGGCRACHNARSRRYKARMRIEGPAS